MTSKTLIPYTLSALLAAGLALSLSQTHSAKNENEILAEKLERGTSSPSSRKISRTFSNQRDQNADASTRRSIREILSSPESNGRVASMLSYTEGLTLEEFPGALEELRRTAPHWDPDGKILAQLLLTKWARLDPDAALASLKKLDLKKHGADPVAVLSGVASEDPAKAKAWLEDPANPMAHYPWMGQMLAGAISKEWVRTDPDAALAWARGLPDSQQAGAYTGVLGTLAMSDPAGAAKLALGLEEGGAKNHVLGEIAQTWAATNPAEALRWASSLEGETSKEAMNQVIGTWAGNDPAAAAKQVESMGADGSNHILPVVNSWSSQDPQAAAEWTMNQPMTDQNGEQVGRALGTALWHWTTRDPESAGNWLNQQEPGPQLDGGMAGLSKAASSFDPEAALQWAGQISHEDTRNLMIADGLRTWSRTDPTAAEAWKTENLPNDDKQE